MRERARELRAGCGAEGGAKWGCVWGLGGQDLGQRRGFTDGAPGARSLSCKSDREQTACRGGLVPNGAARNTRDEQAAEQRVSQAAASTSRRPRTGAGLARAALRPAARAASRGTGAQDGRARRATSGGRPPRRTETASGSLFCFRLFKRARRGAPGRLGRSVGRAAAFGSGRDPGRRDRAPRRAEPASPSPPARVSVKSIKSLKTKQHGLLARLPLSGPATPLPSPQ